MSTNASKLHQSPATGPEGRALSQDARRLLESLSGPPPHPARHPVLVVISGLPGSGKSFFSRSLAKRFPLAMLESDALRKALVASPLHTAQESARLFQAIHEVVDLLLERGIPVLLDATSLVQAQRERLDQIAQGRGVKVILVLVEAPPAVVRQRLEARATATQREDHSDADWEVYQRMRLSQEPILGHYLVVDTTKDIQPAIGRVVREIKTWELKGR